MIELLKSAKTVLAGYLGAKEGEKILIVVDEPLQGIGKPLFEAGKNLKTETVLMEMLPRQSNGEEPPAMISEAMLAADIVVLATSKSLSHTKARKEANQKGARIASMPGITEEAMQRTLEEIDPSLAKRANFYAQLLNKAEEVRITTPAGTDLSFSIKERMASADGGELFIKGSFGNLPPGEAFIAPVEGTAQGNLVIDGSMSGVGLLRNPIHIKVKEGTAYEILGGDEASRLVALVDAHGIKARNIAELGIGLNQFAQLTGSVLEDEKIAGTVHIALGDNSTFGGTVEVASHLDGVLLNPTLWLDGQRIIEAGKFK